MKAEGISIPPFIKNRFKLSELMSAGSIAIISSNRLMPRNGDQYFPFRQNSDFYYLTGIKQSSCTLAILRTSLSDDAKEVLFIPEVTARAEMWNGPGLSLSEAGRISGVSDIRFNSEMESALRDMMRSCNSIYFGDPVKKEELLFPVNEIEIRKGLASEISALREVPISPLMAKLRSLKETYEIEHMKKAIDITGDTFIKILQDVHPGIHEYEIAALMSYEFLRRGSTGHAFDPIVAAGENALVLHYSANSGICRDEQLLLMDFGADWEYYAADISRTIPVNGRFSKRQRELYDANLRVMQKSIHLMTVGKTLKEFNAEVGKLWEEEHVKLGLYSTADIRDNRSEKPLWERYYWHGTSHSIGIDVHDAYVFGNGFKHGMIMSCEPGIYIREEGTGIRLENDILITHKGPLNLSENIPIDPDAIEVIMNKS